jgi:D-lactate dehydrogenase (cytochrome)
MIRTILGARARNYVRWSSTAVHSSLSQLLGSRYSLSESVRQQHAVDESYHSWSEGVHLPDGVAFPTSTEEVSAIVKECYANNVPMIAYGTGTSLEGHITALKKGIVIDMQQMNNIVQINSEDMDCLVQSGVTRIQLNEALRQEGLFFSVDPGANASIGGMASTRASGTTTVKYGAMKENVMGVTAVMADGSIVKTGGRYRKSSSGYDLTNLLVGSEGTLGIITEVRVRLHPVPESIVSGVCCFRTLEGAVRTAQAVIQNSVDVARIELLDEESIHCVNSYSKTSYEPAPTLFFEFHGSPASVEENAKRVAEIAQEFDSFCGQGYAGENSPDSAFRYAYKQEERNALWKARHTAYWAAIASRPGFKGMPTDVCVPISRLTECILETKRDLLSSGLYGPLVGHVGDGNFHMLLVLDPDDKDMLQRAKELSGRLVDRAQEMAGTCTGEHGIGYGKLPYLLKEHGTEALLVMGALKRALDPKLLLNPGKLGSADIFHR